MMTLNNRWTVLALLFFARASMAAHFQSIPPLVPHLIAEWGLNYTQVGLLIGLAMFAGIFLALPGGLLGQRFGDKAVLVGGLALITLGSLVFLAAPSYPVAFAGRLLGGVGVVLLNVQLTKVVNDWFAGREIATSMGILMTAWPFGIALAFTVLPTLAEGWGWRGAIGATAAYSALGLALVALCYRDPPREHASARTITAAPPLWAISRVELASIVTAGLVWMLPNAGFIVFLGFTPALLVAGGLGVAAAALLTGLVSWMSIATIPLGGLLTDRTGRVNAFIVAGALLSAVAIALIPLGAPALAGVLLFGVVIGAWPGAIMTLPGRVLSPAGRSTGFGVFYTVYYAGMAALPPVAGWLQDRTGEARASLLFGALLMAATLPLLAVLRRLQRRAAGRSKASGQEPVPAPETVR